MDAITLVQSITLLSVVKVLVVVLLVVYLAFAYLMMRQIGSMTRAVNLKDDYVISVLGVGHFIFAALVLFIAIIVL